MAKPDESDGDRLNIASWKKATRENASAICAALSKRQGLWEITKTSGN